MSGIDLVMRHLWARHGPLIPDLAPGIDLNVRYVPVDPHLVTAERVPDCVLRGEPNLLLHYEIQARRDPEIAARMAEYAILLYRRFDTMPRQFLILASPRTGEVQGHFRAGAMQHSFELIELWKVPGERVIEAHPALSVAACWDDPWPLVFARIRDRLLRLPLPEQRFHTWATAAMARAVHRDTDVELDARRFAMSLREILDHGELAQEYRSQGEETGRQEGRQEGRTDTLFALLRNRLGPLDDITGRRLRALDTAALDDLLARFDSLTTPAELTAWLNARG